MGLINKPTLKSYWSTDMTQNTPWFGQMFSRNRFECIHMFFHLTDNSKLAKNTDPDYDPTAKFQPAITHANNVSRHHYIPNKQLSIDESLVGTKNYTRLLQYLPNKHHHKWGIKLWVICDSITNYCLGFTCYKGASFSDDREEIKKYGLGYYVVMKLMQMGNYLNKGFHLFVDNFYTSFGLIQDLYRKQTFLTGTIRRNRKNLPNDVKRKFAVGEKKYYRSDYILTLAYREKSSQSRPVILVSSDSQAIDVQTRRTKFGFERIKNKPKVIDEYNRYMGGIDTNDMMLYAYLDERRTVKFWKKVVFNVFGRMVLNSYILYKINCLGKPMTRYQFVVSIIRHN
ncbi:zinc finger protein [Homalodisca vitripennis]|nr:zinc finger protein [Homalodisca vitripennis]